MRKSKRVKCQTCGKDLSYGWMKYGGHVCSKEKIFIELTVEDAKALWADLHRLNELEGIPQNEELMKQLEEKIYG